MSIDPISEDCETNVPDYPNYYNQQFKDLIKEFHTIFPYKESYEIIEMLEKEFKNHIISNFIDYNHHSLRKEIMKKKFLEKREMKKAKEITNEEIHYLEKKIHEYDFIKKSLLNSALKTESTDIFKPGNQCDRNTTDFAIKIIKKIKSGNDKLKKILVKTNSYGIDLLQLQKTLFSEGIIEEELSAMQLVGIINNPFVKYCNYFPSDTYSIEEHSEFKEEFHIKG